MGRPLLKRVAVEAVVAAAVPVAALLVAPAVVLEERLRVVLSEELLPLLTFRRFRQPIRRPVPMPEQPVADVAVRKPPEGVEAQLVAPLEPPLLLVVQRRVGAAAEVQHQHLRVRPLR